MQIGAVWILDKYIEVLQKIQQLSNATRIYETYPEWIEQVTGGLFWITVALSMEDLKLRDVVQIDIAPCY